MNEQQAEQLLQELSQMSEQLSALIELMNNTTGYCEWIAKGKGYGQKTEMDAEQASSPNQYWNRLNEVRRDGDPDTHQLSIPFHTGSEPVLSEELTDEEKAHIVATVASQATRARAAARKANRMKPRRKRRKR